MREQRLAVNYCLSRAEPPLTSLATEPQTPTKLLGSCVPVGLEAGA
jgi:hypothetical protein